MRLSLSLSVLALATTLISAAAVGTSHGLAPLEPRASNTCSAAAVHVVEVILSALKASSFCSGFLHIATVTSKSTVTSFAVAHSTVTSHLTTVILETDTTTLVTETVLSTTQTVAGSPTTTTYFTTTVSEDDVTATTTTTTTSFSTTTIYDVNVDGGNKHKYAARALSTPTALLQYASTLVSEACSCYVTTPTTTIVSTTTSTSTGLSTATDYTTTTSVDSTATVLSTTTDQDVVVTTLTPTITTTTTSTSTEPVTVATSTVTAVRPGTKVDIIDVTLVPISLGGFTPISYTQLIPNVGGGSLDGAAKACYPACAAAGSNCAEIFTAQRTSGGTYDCFLVNAAQEANSNLALSGTYSSSNDYIIIIS